MSFVTFDRKDVPITCVKSNSRSVRYTVHLLVILFGISAWIAVNGLWVELPILVQRLPEKWNLPSYLTVVIQLANIGPIVYGLLHHSFPRRVNETSVTFAMMTVGTLACLALVFLWDRTMVTSTSMDTGKGTIQVHHSVYLFVLVFFVSIVDCTSSVVYLPFMAFFKEKYVLSLFIGEGFSGLLPGLVALAQSVSSSDSTCSNMTNLNANITETSEMTALNFGVGPFFTFLTVMMSISFVAFILLRYLPLLASERVVNYNSESLSSEYVTISTGTRSSNYGTSDIVGNAISTMEDNGNCQGTMMMSGSTLARLFAMQAWICVLANGVLPSISSYYSLPYGYVAYHWVVTLSSFANPLACFATTFFTVRDTIALALLTALGSLFAVYLIVLAVLSPTPPFVGTLIGTFLVVLASIFFTAISSFTKTSLAYAFRTRGKVNSLFWCGAATQAGSTIGSLIMFIVVNYLNVFHSHRACA